MRTAQVPLWSYQVPPALVGKSRSGQVPDNIVVICLFTETPSSSQRMSETKAHNHQNFSRASFVASDDPPLVSCCTCAPPSNFDPVPEIDKLATSGKSTALISASAFWDLGAIVHLNFEG